MKNPSTHRLPIGSFALVLFASSHCAQAATVISFNTGPNPVVDGRGFGQFYAGNAFNATIPKIITGQINTGTTYSGPDVYGGVFRTTAASSGGVGDNSGSSYRLRVEATTDTTVAVDALHMFQLADLGTTTWMFDAANDTLDASAVILSGGAVINSASIGMRSVIREGNNYYASASNSLTSPAPGNYPYSVEATEVNWFAYDPVTNVAASTIAGNPTALASI